MKKYISPIPFWGGTEFKIYELEKDLYKNINDRNLCYSLEDVEKYPNLFLFSDTIEDIQIQINKWIQHNKYGDGQKGDIQCPKCEYWFDLNKEYMNDDDEFSTPGIDEFYSTNITCTCGCKFNAKIKEVKIEWEVKEI